MTIRAAPSGVHTKDVGHRSQSGATSLSAPPPIGSTTSWETPGLSGPGNQFDDAFGDYQLMNEPPPAASSLPQTPLSQYQTYAPAGQPAAPAKDYSGAFGMEKKALDGGLLVGIGVTLLGCLWLFGGLAADRFFPYSIVVILIGVVGTIKGFIGLFK